MNFTEFKANTLGPDSFARLAVTPSGCAKCLLLTKWLPAVWIQTHALKSPEFYYFLKYMQGKNFKVVHSDFSTTNGKEKSKLAYRVWSRKIFSYKMSKINKNLSHIL